MPNKFQIFMRGITRLAVVAGILVTCWTILILAVYGAHKLAERFGVY